MFHDRSSGDDAVLDALARAKEAELDAQLRDPAPRDTSGIPPNSVARPGIHVDDGQREVDRLVAWIDALIESRFRAEEDDSACRADDQDDDTAS